MDKDNILKDLYYDKSSTAYLSSAKTLHKIVKQNHKDITLKYVSDWLTKQEVNQRLNNKQDIYYPPIVAEGPHDYQCDLTFL